MKEAGFASTAKLAAPPLTESSSPCEAANVALNRASSCFVGAATRPVDTMLLRASSHTKRIAPAGPAEERYEAAAPLLASAAARREEAPGVE